MRQFDLEAAKNRATFVHNNWADKAMRFIGLHSNGNIVGEYVDNGMLTCYPDRELRMTPRKVVKWTLMNPSTKKIVNDGRFYDSRQDPWGEHQVSVRVEWEE